MFIVFIVGLLSNGVMIAAASDLEVMVGGKVITDKGEWFTPLNAPNNKVALFSEQRDGFSLYNRSGAPMVITSISLVPDPEAVEEEWTLQTADLKHQPLQFQETVIEPGNRFDFFIRYYPVQSKHLGATITITYNTSQEFSFRISGKGRDNAVFHSASKTIAQKLFGGPLTDEMTTGMVMDGKGRVFFSGQVTEVVDKFAYDIFYGCINPDNTLGWARLWSGPFRESSPDSGQNAETGGTANAIGMDEDGFIYIAGSVSPGKSNNNFAVLIMKINPDTGEPVWEKAWRPEWPGALLAKHSAEAYGLDVRNGQVYITGTTGAGIDGSDALVLILSLSAQDGSLLYQQYLDPIPKTNDRGYAVRTDGKGSVYIGGLTGKYGLLAKLTESPDKKGVQIAWVREVNMGWGSNINCLDLDAEGNLYISADRRGAATFFSVLKMDPDGNLLWGKTYKGGNNKNNNVSVVKVLGDFVFAGGRTGQGWYDSQMGDALVVKLNTADGKERWSAFYYTGKGPDEMCEHRIKGLAVKDDELILLGQVYSSSFNGVRYWGYWYDGVGAVEDFKPGHIKDLGMKPEDAQIIPHGEVKDASGMRTLVDLAELLPFQDAVQKHDGKAPDGDVMFWRLKLKEKQ